MRIADNKKALFNYLIEERFEAGMVLEGWEVKSLREGKVQLTDGYVVIRNGELFIIGCQINPLGTASTHVRPGLGAHQEAADAQGRDPPPDRQDRAEGLHPGAAEPALEGRQGQMRDRRWPRARANTTSATPSRTAKASARSNAP